MTFVVVSCVTLYSTLSLYIYILVFGFVNTHLRACLVSFVLLPGRHYAQIYG